MNKRQRRPDLQVLSCSMSLTLISGIVAGAVSYIDERIWRTSDIYLAIKSFRFVRKTAKTKALYRPASSAKWMLSNPMLPNPTAPIVSFYFGHLWNRSNHNSIKSFQKWPIYFLLVKLSIFILKLGIDFRTMRIKRDSILIVIFIYLFFKYAIINFVFINIADLY